MLWVDNLLFAATPSAPVSDSNFADITAWRIQCATSPVRSNAVHQASTESDRFTCIQARERCIHKLFGSEI
jgi:hypothetical protein